LPQAAQGVVLALAFLTEALAEVVHRFKLVAKGNETHYC